MVAAAPECVCSCPCNSCNNTATETTVRARSTPYSHSDPRTSTRTILLEGVKQAKKEQLEQQKWTKPFHSYQKKTKQNIIRHISCWVMAACAHPELFNDEDEGGMKYIEYNRNFKMDCSILLEKVTQYVGTKVKQDFNSNYFDNSIRYLPEGKP